jgi:polyhydroxybutyrate depolymerase
MRILLPILLALVAISPSRAADLERREFTVDGVAREALVYIPTSAKTDATPVVFAFHGHGGNMRNAARSFAYHSAWPEAIVVYPQGLNTPGRLTDPEGKKPGWQGGVGDQGDRDLKFFDTMLSALEKDAKVDSKRIYSTGHSNGGGFTYLLWAARGEKLAAVAPSAAAAARSRTLLKPKPVLHAGSEKDPLVKFEWQRATIEIVKNLNECGEGQPWKAAPFTPPGSAPRSSPISTKAATASRAKPRRSSSSSSRSTRSRSALRAHSSRKISRRYFGPPLSWRYV